MPYDPAQGSHESRTGAWGMAYYRKHRDGWRAEVQRNGVRRSAVWPTKKQAQDWARQVELELKAGRGRAGTVAQAVQKFSQTRPDTWTAHRLAAMVEHFGAGTRLDAITRQDIADWRDTRLKTVSPSTVLREANLYRSLFRAAVDEWQWLTESPWARVTLPEHNPPRQARWDWRRIRRVCRFLGHRTGQRPETAQQEVALAFLIALRTALRAQEVLQAPAGFNPATRVVALTKTKTTRAGEVVRVPVTRQAARLLGLVNAFTVTSQSMDALFRKARDRTMAGDLVFHDARATALTLLAKKVDVLVLARISRHKDLRMLSQVYYRATAEEIARGL